MNPKSSSVDPHGLKDRMENPPLWEAGATDFWRPSWGLERYGVRMHLSPRAGGVSKAPYDSLNLGLHVGDDPEAVAINRALLEKRLGAKAIFFDQVHGVQCLRVDANTPNGLKADGAYTLERGVACTMMVADCMPLLLADEKARVVGAVHVGWRGLVGMGEQGQLLPQGVVEQAHMALTRGVLESTVESGVRLHAWLGPCIGPNAFEVGPEVLCAFTQRNPLNARFFKPHPHQKNKWLADLPQLVRALLTQLGVTHLWGNDGSPNWCTVNRADLYFSHRRDRVSGRFAASIWIAPEENLGVKL